MIKDEFEKAYFNAKVKQEFGGPFPDPDLVAVWTLQWSVERCGNIANRIMADQTDPAKACGAQEVKMALREIAKELQ